MDQFEPTVFADLIAHHNIRSTVLPPAAITMLNDDERVVDLAPLVQGRADWSTLDDVLAGFRAMLESEPRWVGLDSALINLPAGRAGRILRDRAGESESVHTYVFTRADAWFYVECVVHSDPSEDSRAIAETWEWLPAEE